MTDEGVGDEPDEEREGNGPLLGAAVRALEDAPEEGVVGNEVEESQAGVGQGQPAAGFEVEGGVHRSPSQMTESMSSWEVTPGQ